MWHDIEQNTDEWLDLRMAKVTGSSIAKVMAHFGKPFGKPAKDLAVTIAVESITGKRQESNHYMNAHMERGHSEEPIARALYEDLHFVDVTNGGFYDNIVTGSSPDGRVGENGLIEIKSAIPSMHYERIKRGTFDPSYKWQLLFNLIESGREWIDFISYCSTFPEDKQLYEYRVFAEDHKEDIKKISERKDEFFCMVNDIKERINRG